MTTIGLLLGRDDVAELHVAAVAEVAVVENVSIITGFTGIGLSQKDLLAKKMRNACGGTVTDRDIEIPCAQHEKITRNLTEAGFRPVFVGDCFSGAKVLLAVSMLSKSTSIFRWV